MRHEAILGNGPGCDPDEEEGQCDKDCGENGCGCGNQEDRDTDTPKTHPLD